MCVVAHDKTDAVIQFIKLLSEHQRGALRRRATRKDAQTSADGDDNKKLRRAPGLGWVCARGRGRGWGCARGRGRRRDKINVRRSADACPYIGTSPSPYAKPFPLPRLAHHAVCIRTRASVHCSTSAAGVRRHAHATNATDRPSGEIVSHRSSKQAM